MNALPPRSTLLLLGDDRERLLRIASAALQRGLVVTLAEDADLAPTHYDCIAVACSSAAARDRAASRVNAHGVAAVFLDDAADESDFCARFAATADAPPADGCVVISTFRVANGMSASVAQAFRERPHHVDSEAGFREFHVISPSEDPNEFWLLTAWSDAQAFESWHHSHLYREAHSGIPRGLRLDPTATKVRLFKSIAR